MDKGSSLPLAQLLKPSHVARIGSLIRELAVGLEEQCLSEYSFTNLWLFRREHRYAFADGAWPCISGYTYDGVKHAMPLFPLHEAPAEVLDALLLQHDCLYPISRAQMSRLDLTLYRAQASRDDADYVYPAEQFRHYRGAVLAKKRNLMKQLLRDHRVQAETYGPEGQAAAREVLAGWMREKDKAEGSADELPCLEALARASELNLEGFSYIVDGEPAGFVLAEALQPGVFAMRFAKSLGRYKGLAQYMFHHFCMARPDVHWLNFEQDLGLPNFRQTKQSYQPENLLEKFRVTKLR